MTKPKIRDKKQGQKLVVSTTGTFHRMIRKKLKRDKIPDRPIVGICSSSTRLKTTRSTINLPPQSKKRCLVASGISRSNDKKLLGIEPLITLFNNRIRSESHQYLASPGIHRQNSAKPCINTCINYIKYSVEHPGLAGTLGRLSCHLHRMHQLTFLLPPNSTEQRDSQRASIYFLSCNCIRREPAKKGSREINGKRYF